MSKTGIIQPIDRFSDENNENDDYHDFWEEKEVVNKAMPKDFFVTDFNFIVNLIKGTKDLLCIISESFVSESLVSVILELIKQKRIRIYLILRNLDKSESQSTDQKKYLSKIAGKCNIRYFNSFPGSLILIDPNSKSKRAYYFTSGLSDFGKLNEINYNLIIFDINPDFIDEYFNFFKFTFWNRCTHEILNADMLDAPRSAEKLPVKLEKESNYQYFGFNEQNSQNVLEYISKLLNYSYNNSKTIKAYWEYPFSDQLINNLINEIQKNPEESYFLTLADMGFDVYFKNNNGTPNAQIFKTDLHFPFDIIINHNLGLIIVNSPNLTKKSDIWSMGFLVSSDAVKKLDDFLKWLKNRAKFVYYKSKKINEITHPFHYTDKKEVHSIDHSQVHEIKIKDIYTKTIDEFLVFIENKRDCSEFKQKDYVKNRYKWTVFPPYKEKNIKKDDLYQQWIEFKANYEDSVKWIENKIVESRKLIEIHKEDPILTQFFLVKSMKLNKIEEDSRHLKGWGDYSRNREELIEKVKEFDTFLTQINSELQEINNAISNSKEIQQYQREKERLSTEKDSKLDLSTKITKEIEEIEKIQIKINDELIISKKSLEKSKEKKKKKNIEKEIKEGNKIIDGKQEEIDKLKKKSIDNQRELEDLDEKIQNIENSITKIKRNLGEIEKEPKSKSVLQDFARQISNRKENKQNDRDVEIPYINNKIPSQNLPQIGILYANKDHKILAIKMYEEIEQAKQIAEYYHAEVVIDKSE